MTTLSVVCPGCRSWGVSWDPAALAATLEVPAVVNGVVERVGVTEVVEVVLQDHILACRGVQGWFEGSGRARWRAVIGRRHPLREGRLAAGGVG